MTKGKKLLSILLSVAMLAGTCPTMAYADEDAGGIYEVIPFSVDGDEPIPPSEETEPQTTGVSLKLPTESTYLSEDSGPLEQDDIQPNETDGKYYIKTITIKLADDYYFKGGAPDTVKGLVYGCGRK